MKDNNKDLKKRRVALEQLRQERAKRNTGIRVMVIITNIDKFGIRNSIHCL